MSDRVLALDATLEALVGQVADEFTERRSQGEQPDIEEYAQRYPEVADVLRQVLAALQVLGPADLQAASGSDRREDAAPLAGVLGDFRLVREIGRGGMGIVYEAEQLSLGRRVALKVLPFAGALDARQLQRFALEARAAALLHHQSIVPVYFVGCERGVHFYAMQLIEGQTLAQLIRQLRQENGLAPAEPDAAEPPGPSGAPTTAHPPAPQLTPAPAAETAKVVPASRPTERSLHSREHCRMVARLGVQAAEALDHAHQRGIVHRDVKPGNLLLDGEGNLWVTDFGLARFQSDTKLTLSGDLVGTLRYMSPEQAMAQRVVVDHRTDVYSLGQTLYEVLTLRPAFTGSDRQELLRQIAFEEPSPPRRLNPALPRELETIVLKAAAKHPAERYATAQELAEDLQRFLRDEPIRARRATLGQRLRRWGRRHQTLAWSTTMAALVALLMLAGSIGYVVRDQADRLAKTQQQVGEALAGARTAIQAGDLALASQRVAEAWGQLGPEGRMHALMSPKGVHLRALALAIAQVGDDITGRQADGNRFQDFLKRASDGQDKMAYDVNLGGDIVAREALDLYGVLAGEEWLSRLERSSLTAAQKQQVRETAYITLLSLAACEVRWHDQEPQAASRSLELLQRAQAFHEPTRAFFFVRSECHRRQGNPAAAAEDVKRFQAAAARTAWDYYLPGHTAGWRGDLPEAIRSYQRALTLQPNHYNALFFLAKGLATDQLKRWPEAIQLYTGCIALRPDHVLAHVNRAACYQKLGQVDEAEAAYTAAIAAVQTEMDRAYAYEGRRDFYEAVGRGDKAREDREHVFQVYEQLKAQAQTTVDGAKVSGIVDQVYRQAAQGRLQEAMAQSEKSLGNSRARLGPDHPLTLDNMSSLALSYHRAGRLQEAMALDEQTLEKRKAKLGPDHPDTLTSMNNLAMCYRDAGRLPEAMALLEQTLRQRKAKLGPDDRHTLISMNNLSLCYEDAGRLPEAMALAKEALEKHKAKLGPDHPDTLTSMNNLAALYETAERFAEAEPLWRSLLERRRKRDGPKAATTADALARLSLTLLGQQKYVEAEPLLRECLAMKLPEAWQRFNTLSQLGGALLGQKQYQAAEPLLLQGYADMKQFEASIPPPGRPRLTEALQRLVQLYDALGRKEEKAQWTRKLQAAKRAEELWMDLQTPSPRTGHRFTETRHEGSLTAQAPQHVHALTLEAGKTYVLDLESTAFDAFLILEDTAGAKVAENDDISRTNRNARLIYAPEHSGAYRVIATSYQHRGTGPYVLRIRELVQEAVKLAP
jgi:serine/threonine protein kinase